MKMEHAVPKPEVAEVVEAAGLLAIFLPKFHCELSFIEFFWGAAKRFVRGNIENCAYTFEELRQTVPRGLKSVSVLTIRRFEHRMHRWVKAYQEGKNVVDAGYQSDAESLLLPLDVYPDILLIKIYGGIKTQTSITLLTDHKNWLKGMAFFLADSAGHCSHLDNGGNCLKRLEFFLQRFAVHLDRLPTNLPVRQSPMKKPSVIAQHMAHACRRFNEFPALKRICQMWSRLRARSPSASVSFSRVLMDQTRQSTSIAIPSPQDPFFPRILSGSMSQLAPFALPAVPTSYGDSAPISNSLFTNNSNNINRGILSSVRPEQVDAGNRSAIHQLLQFADFIGATFPQNKYDGFLEENDCGGDGYCLESLLRELELELELELEEPES
ncbi:hypothetical protein BT69DRAFT_1295977 [Atractiella rhizophila]|nr:hypothetical protein BT69DRAFT_1295977 [Atractiella rhizophila]